MVHGGLEAFQKLSELEKLLVRKRAIGKIGDETATSNKVGVVAGHFMFWPEGKEKGVVCTLDDLKTYTHILYLDMPAETVAQQHQDNTKRTRPVTSVNHLDKWQEAEKSRLRRLCRHHDILFSLVSPRPTLLDRALTLLRDFQRHDQMYNLSRAESELDKIVFANRGKLTTMLIMDADKTLAAEDTGELFWKKVSSSQGMKDEDYPLKALFSSRLSHSYNAFRQATLLYEEAADDQEFDAICREVALAVPMYSEFVSLLQLVAESEHVGAVIVTCGLRRVWEKILEREGLAETVRVIGGGRVADGMVITANVKAVLVARLQDIYKLRVWAFGDGPLDLDMMKKADWAVIVVGEEQKRSKSMDVALEVAIDHGLDACQALLPSNVSPRSDITKLPLAQLTGQQIVDSLFGDHSRQTNFHVLHTTDRGAAKLLMTPMRDATVAGPILREAHRRVGSYLATKFLTTLIGMEEYPIPHVLPNHHISGCRIRHEDKTLIVALMRGGEPMASGVNDVFPLAMFFHAKSHQDITPHQLQGRQTVVLVDSVVNTGKTIVESVQHIRDLHATIRIVVVAGVVQAQFASSDSLGHYANLSMVALRISETKFTGSGTTDTGNHLFNTTHLP